jgi:hypothetical protein
MNVMNRLKIYTSGVDHYNSSITPDLLSVSMLSHGVSAPVLETKLSIIVNLHQ